MSIDDELGGGTSNATRMRGCELLLLRGSKEVLVSCRTLASVLLMTVMTMSGAVADIAAQRRAPDQQRATQAIQVSLTVGGQRYDASARGSCTHAPKASIYQKPSALWMVQQSLDTRSISLTFWKPHDGSGDMVNLSVQQGSGSHEVNTVRGGATTGSGKVTFDKAGNGGIFSVDVKTSGGVAITGTIKCDAFAPHVAEGGS